MRLVLVDDDGTIHPITEDIEEYNLDNVLATAEIINDLKDCIQGLRPEA